GLDAARRVDDHRRRARLAADADEVVQDALLGHPIEDVAARAAAGEARRDHGLAQALERAGHVHALASRDHDALLRAVAVTQLEVRNSERLVDRGIRGHGENHRCAAPIGVAIVYAISAKKL